MQVLDMQLSFAPDSMIDDQALGLTDPLGPDGGDSVNLTPMVVISVCVLLGLALFMWWWLRHRDGVKQTIKLLEVETVGASPQHGGHKRGSCKTAERQVDGTIALSNAGLMAAHI
jgi:hypothetical protein